MRDVRALSSVRRLLTTIVSLVLVLVLPHKLQYAGTNAEFTKADSVIFRSDLYNLTNGRKEANFKRTVKYDSKLLDSKLKDKNIYFTLAYKYNVKTKVN